MTVTTFDTGRHCVRCRRWNDAQFAACRFCLAPLNDRGVLEGLRAPAFPWRLLVLAPALAVAIGAAIPLVPRLVGPARVSPRSRPAVRRIAVPIPRGPGLAKFEPARGCFIGAFVSQDPVIAGSMRRWEQVTGKGHFSYLRYLGYGQPFPKAWVADVRRLGAVPHLAFEPNEGLRHVREDAYLLRFARDAAESGGPVFLRFASEMNGAWTAYHGDPARYRAAFRLVARVMHREAPNVAMVWTPFCRPLRNMTLYYPGDDFVDWVGVNIYSVHHHNGDPQQPAHWEDPVRFLDDVYRRFARRKPIQISEYAASGFCRACGEDTTRFALEKMTRLYASLPRRFPRVKAVYWFDWDTLSAGVAENDYSITDNPVLRQAYRRLTASSYFLSRMPEGQYWVLRPRGAP